MRNSYHYFLAALQFLTRIPVPRGFIFRAEYLERSSTFFPLVGQLVALFGFGSWWLVHHFLGAELAILVSMIVTMAVTGAFHEDGLADTFDAFGGGWTKEKILTIMKDSRLGTYGMIALLGVLAAKFLLLQAVVLRVAGVSGVPAVSGVAGVSAAVSAGVSAGVSDIFWWMLAAHGLSRFMAVTIIQQYAYVTDIDQSKSKPLSKSVLSAGELAAGFLLAVWPLFFVSPWYWLVLLPMYLVRSWMGRFFRRWIGGYTGDCLGATQQVTEIIFYLSVLIIGLYIL